MKAHAATEAEEIHSLPQEPEDYSIYLHMDGIRSSAKWRLGSYGDQGILSPAMIRHLSDAFELSTSIVRRLSVELGHCLDGDDDIAINLVEVQRAEAIARGRAQMERIRRQARNGRTSPQTMQQDLGKLSTYFATSPKDAALLPELMKKLDQVKALNSDIYRDIKRIIETPGAVAELSPRDKRRVRDMRRMYVVQTCCYAWKDAGRDLTYTTYSDGREDGQRHGPLIQFIQTVVMMITDPPQELSGETIRVDIDRFREVLKSDDQWSNEPPEIGNQYT